MKLKIGVGIALLLAVLGVAFWEHSQIPLAASQIVPGRTLFYLEVPHFIQTAKNLPDTALYQIFQEPSVRRFIKVSELGLLRNSQNFGDTLKKLGCSALFFCLVDPDHQHWMAGLKCSLSGAARTAEIQRFAKLTFARDAVYISADQPHKDHAAENPEALFFSEIGGWTVFSRDSRLLEEGLQSVRSGTRGLQGSPLFLQCRSNMGKAYDLLVFARGSPSLDLGGGSLWEFDRSQDSRESRAYMVATTIEGARLRDTMFTCTGEDESNEPLGRRGLVTTGPNTIGYLAAKLKLSEMWRLANKFSADSPFAATLRDCMDETRSFGVEPPDLDRLVTGLELVVDQNPGADSVTGAVFLEISDEGRFKRLMDSIVREKFPTSCRSTTVNGVPAYILSANENASFVFGLVRHKLLIALSESVFAEMTRRVEASDQGLAGKSQFREAASLVAPPSDLFLYIDAKAGFERLYSAARPMLIFGAALMPAVDRYVDVMALPETAEIAKHLSPIVLSRHRVPGGIVDESVGPVTAYEASAAAVYVAMATGLIQRK